MNSNGQYPDLSCADQIRIAEHELFAFIRAVTQLYGPGEAKIAAEDWLDESGLMKISPLPANWNWRAVTIAASSRLANRLAVPLQHASEIAFMREFDSSSPGAAAAERAG